MTSGTYFLLSLLYKSLQYEIATLVFVNRTNQDEQAIRAKLGRVLQAYSKEYKLPRQEIPEVVTCDAGVSDAALAAIEYWLMRK